jgi:membrane protein implicated in regulation of membrane protease activity
MTWSDFYLTCFVAGFVLSLVSFLGGSFHLPHVHLHIHHAGAKGGGAFNLGTITAFLVWFGGVGFLLTRFYSVGLILATGAAVVAGLIAALIVFLFLARVLGRNDRDLDPADFEMRGVLGRVSSTVRERGTGEMIFTQQGTRRGVPIRGEAGQAIAKGTEVVVTRYEHGIAYVREFEGAPES